MYGLLEPLQSLLKTLAAKASVAQVCRRYKTTIQTERGPRLAFQATVDIRENERTDEKLWVITEWDRSVTTLLRPAEY